MIESQPEIVDKLKSALDSSLWRSHKKEDRYRVDGKGVWKVAYYPILGCGKTQKEYDEPRALMETKKNFNGEVGVDFREMPLRYITRI